METGDDLLGPELLDTHVKFLDQRLFLNNQIFATNFVNSQQSEVVGVEQSFDNLLEKAKNSATSLLVNQTDEPLILRHLQNSLSFEESDAFHHNPRMHIVGEQMLISE